MRTATALGIAALAALTAGCLPVAVAGASQGIQYTFTQTAYRTFTNTRTQAHSAAVQSLAKMQIVKVSDDKTEDSIRIEAKTEKLTVYIWLEAVTPKVTRVSVNAKRNLLVKDKPVAVEILMQMGRALGAP